jgi:two-component system chemotaxis response regulator CheY
MQRVLIIDDSSATRAYIRAALEEMAEMQVSEAASGFDALRVLPRERFDLLVVDINMPNINGLELISFIRRSETHRDTPLLIISTEASERDRSRAMQLGANAYLAKPFTAEALAEAVRGLNKAPAEGA